MRGKASNLHIDFSERFNKQRKKAPLHIKIAFRETVALFLEDPNHSHLSNHALRGRFIGYRSIDITEDWRAVFKEKYTKMQKTIVFHMLGTHEELYWK